MTSRPYIINGGTYRDTRGKLLFINDFDFQGVKRFYIIEHLDTKIIRAWQAHQYETKYFFCLTGAFEVRLVKIDSWENPSRNLKYLQYQLTGEEVKILVIPPGYANGFKAQVQGSKLMVFSDKTLRESAEDDYRYDANYWFNWKTI